MEWWGPFCLPSFPQIYSENSCSNNHSLLAFCQHNSTVLFYYTDLHLLEAVLAATVMNNYKCCSVHENHRTCRTFPMARPKCLMRDFTNLNRIYKAHWTNVWWTIKVFHEHWKLLRCRLPICLVQASNDEVLFSWWCHEMKHFLHYWPFVRGIHQWLVNSPHIRAINVKLWCFLCC